MLNKVSVYVSEQELRIELGRCRVFRARRVFRKRSDADGGSSTAPEPQLSQVCGVGDRHTPHPNTPTRVQLGRCPLRV